MSFVINPYRFASGYTDDAGTEALAFYGTANYGVDCGGDASLDDTFTSGGTVVARINARSGGENGAGRIVSKNQWEFLVVNEAAGFCGMKFIRNYSTTAGQWETTDENIPLNSWVTVAVAYSDGTANDPTFYINGVEYTVGSGVTETLAPAGSAAGDNGTLFLGIKADSTREFDGRMDWVRLYDKELSEAEMQDISAMSANRIEAWELEEGTGTTAAASISTPTNDGTIVTKTPWALAYGALVDAGTYAVLFDGANDYIDCGSDASIDNVFSGGGTVVARIYPETEGENAGRIFDKRGSTAGVQLATFNTVGSHVGLRFFRDFSATDGQWDTESLIPLNAWSTVAVAYDDTTTDPKIYINGVPAVTTETSTPAGAAVTDAANNWLIGSNSATTRSYDGKIDWVRIYDKQLSEAELQDVSAMSANLVEAWELEENTGTTAAAEISTPTNDGTLTNAPTWTTT